MDPLKKINDLLTNCYSISWLLFLLAPERHLIKKIRGDLLICPLGFAPAYKKRS